MAQKCCLMIVGDYVEGYEVTVPFQALQAYGMKVDAVCPGKKAGDSCKTAIHDFLGHQTYSELPGPDFELTTTFEEVDVNKYDILVIPGGRAPEYLSVNDAVLELVKSFSALNRPIASICHGQLILAAAGLLKGKKCTAYPTLKPLVEDVGGLWIDPSPINTCCVAGNIITAAAWPGLSEFLKLILKALNADIINSKKQILIVCGDNIEDYEVMIPHQAFEGLNCTVHTVCPDKKAGEKVTTSVIAKPGHNYTLNANFDHVNADEYDALILPGGEAPEMLSLNEKVLEIVRVFAKARKPIAAICHGQQILAAAGVVKGKKLTAFPGVKPQILGVGGVWVDAESLATCFKDGNFVTGATWFGNPEFLSMILSLLGTKVVF